MGGDARKLGDRLSGGVRMLGVLAVVYENRYCCLHVRSDDLNGHVDFLA